MFVTAWRRIFELCSVLLVLHLPLVQGRWRCPLPEPLTCFLDLAVFMHFLTELISFLLAMNVSSVNDRYFCFGAKTQLELPWQVCSCQVLSRTLGETEALLGNSALVLQLPEDRCRDEVASNPLYSAVWHSTAFHSLCVYHFSQPSSIIHQLMVLVSVCCGKAVV